MPDSEPPPPATTTHRRGTVTAVLVGLVAFGPLSTDLYLPSLPFIARAFEVESATVQLTLSVFVVGFAVAQLIYGPLSDRFGRRPVVLAGLSIFVAATIGCALAPSIDALIAFRFLQALGACAGPVLGRAIVRDIYGTTDAARMLSLISMIMAAGPAVAPLVGGILTAVFGWRSAFWLLTGIAVVVLAGVVALLPETNRDRDLHAFRPGQMLANYRMLLRNRVYVGYVAVVATGYSAMFSFLSASSFVLQDGLGLGPATYALCFSVVVMGFVSGGFATQLLIRRLGIDRLIGIGSVVMIVAAVAMTAPILLGHVGVVTIVGPAALMTMGMALNNPSAMAGAIGPFARLTGTAAALLGFLQMTAAALVGIVVGQLTVHSPLPMALAMLTMAIATMTAHRLLVLRGRRLAGTA